MKKVSNASKASKAIRFALSTVLPIALMTFAMAKTNISDIIIIGLTLGLAVGMMLTLRVFEIPSTEVERRLVREEAILQNIRALFPDIATAAKECPSQKVRGRLGTLVGTVEVLIGLFATDDMDSSELAKEIFTKLSEVQIKVVSINRLDLDPENAAFDVVAGKISSLNKAFTTMLEEYRAGAIHDAVQALEILEKQLKIQGY